MGIGTSPSVEYWLPYFLGVLLNRYRNTNLLPDLHLF